MGKFSLNEKIVIKSTNKEGIIVKANTIKQCLFTNEITFLCPPNYRIKTTNKKGYSVEVYKQEEEIKKIKV